jgi:ABC-type sugar transport system ATPase subunit
MAEIRLRDVRKTYPGGHEAVQGVDLAIADGELLVLVGPSGCGKSTTLRLVAGLETPTAGTITIGARDVTRVAPQDRDLAMVFQSYALYPHKTVRENLAFPLRMRHVPAAEIPGRIDAVAHVLGIDGLLDQRPRQLSGGQRQRVALGRAIVRQPRAFLLDEPLSNLDAKLRVQTRAELARIHRQLGATMLYVTHDQEEAMTLGDRIAVMHGGRLLQVAAPMEVYRRPANRFVAGFIGSPAMNFLPGTMVTEGDGGVLVGIRPHDVQIVAADEGDLGARVEVVEPLGPELLVHVTPADAPGAEPLRIVAPADQAIGEGTQVGLRLRRDRLHRFAAESGERL